VLFKVKIRLNFENYYTTMSESGKPLTKLLSKTQLFGASTFALLVLLVPPVSDIAGTRKVSDRNLGLIGGALFTYYKASPLALGN